MNKKLLGILVVIVSLLIMGGIVYVVFLGNNPISKFLGEEKETEVVTDDPETPVSAVAGKPRVPEAVIRQRPAELKPEPKEIEPIKRSNVNEFNKSDIMRMAASFTERFGSYSNHSNFSNIIDLKIFMSVNMARWADTFVFEQRKNGLSDAMYFGITTKAVNEEVKAFDDDTGFASVLVSTRRREYTGTTTNLSNSYDQLVQINFVNERGAWKIDDANWQDQY
jgi:hypothetical protein